MVRSSPLGAVGVLVSLLGLVTLARSLPPAAPPSRVTPTPTPAGPSCVDVNTASASRLEDLPRVGPALAARIVEDRRTNGAFTSVGSLERVRGIGPRLLETLVPHLCDLASSNALRAPAADSTHSAGGQDAQSLTIDRGPRRTRGMSGP